jgi:hypothetical protein
MYVLNLLNHHLSRPDLLRMAPLLPKLMLTVFLERLFAIRKRSQNWLCAIFLVVIDNFP